MIYNAIFNKPPAETKTYYHQINHKSNEVKRKKHTFPERITATILLHFMYTNSWRSINQKTKKGRGKFLYNFSPNFFGD